VMVLKAGVELRGGAGDTLGQRTDEHFVCSGVVEEERNPQKGMVYEHAVYGAEAGVVDPFEDFRPSPLIVFEVEAELNLRGAGVTSGVRNRDPVPMEVSQIHPGVTRGSGW
jgi:hypothetical protein